MNIYQTHETLFDRLDSYGIDHTNEQTISKNLAKFDFESNCVHEENFKDTNTLDWIRKHIPILFSISSKLLEEPLLLCNSNLQHFVISFIGALENLAVQSNASK